MATQPTDERWQEIRSIHQDYRFFYEMGLGIGLVMVGIVVGFALFPDDIGYRGNLFTTILGVVITVVVLDRRAERRSAQQLKEQFIRQLRSKDNGIASLAAEELKAKGWLTDGSLIMARLYYANLKNADLRQANLQSAYMRGANLEGTWLQAANVRGVNFEKANLLAARFYEPKHGKAIFDETTILPDGSKWTTETDMQGFTDSTHPEFWRSDDPHSPAYWGKKEE